MSSVYLIRSQKDSSYYTGLAENVEKRLSEHNAGLVKSTKSKIPYELVWSCVFENREKAVVFEKYLKTGSGIAFRNKHLT